MAAKVITIEQSMGEKSAAWDKRVNEWLTIHDGKVLQVRVNIDESGLSSIVALYEEMDGIPGPTLRRPIPTENQEGSLESKE